MSMNFPTRNQKVQPYSSWKGGKLKLHVSVRFLSLSWNRSKNQRWAVIRKRFKPQSLSKWLLGFIITILKQIKGNFSNHDFQIVLKNQITKH
jgi:hypothetical protein